MRPRSLPAARTLLPWLGVAFVLWAAPAITGFVSTSGRSLVDRPPESLEILSLSGGAAFVAIMRRNLFMIAVNLSGIGLVGAPTVSCLAFNGFLTGAAFKMARLAELGWAEVLLVSAPHSVELLALWLSGAVGLQGIRFAYVLLRHGRLPEADDAAWMIGAAGLCVVLIIVAAWAEAFISFEIARGN